MLQFLLLQSQEDSGRKILQYSFIWKEITSSSDCCLRSYIDRWLKRESEQFPMITYTIGSHCNGYKHLGQRLIDSGSFNALRLFWPPVSNENRMIPTEWSETEITHCLKLPGLTVCKIKCSSESFIWRTSISRI